MNLDQDRLAMLWAALAGSALWGLWTFAGLLAVGQTPGRADWIRAGVNIVCASTAGGLMAYFLGPSIVGLIPWSALKDPTAVGFIVGAAGWELVPILLAVVKSRAGKLEG